MIDTHLHLYAEEFNTDRSTVIQKANDVGVTKFLLPNIDLNSIQGMHALVEEYPNQFFPMMGLHPCSVNDNYKEVLDKLKAQLKNGSYVAVGEIGIDLYWDKSTYDIQKEAFLVQCEWAMQLDLPIVIHSRESIDPIVELLKPLRGKIRGVFHCFTGTVKQAESILDLGFYVGIGGVVTFKNTTLREVLGEAVPLNKVLLETDSPYLAPTPYRGKRNEPAYLEKVVLTLADVYGCSEEEVDRTTTANALRLFNL